MKNAKSLILPLVMTILMVGFITGSLNAQTVKIGVVDDAEVLANFPAWERAAQEFAIQQTAWNEEAQSMQNDLQEIFNEYEKQKLILSEEKRSEREAAIRAKEESLRAYTAQIFGPGGTAERTHAQLTTPLQDQISQAIQTVAEADGYDVVFTLGSSGIAYFKQTYDITKKVLNALEDQE